MEAVVIDVGAAYEVEQAGRIGYGEGISKELEILNRTVRVVDSENWVELEPDKRLIEKIVSEYNLGDAKTTVTPRTKLTVEEAESRVVSDDLLGAEATRYRSATMRAAYLGQDRLDIAESVKVLAQHMKVPKQGHVADVKRLARYMKGVASLVLTFPPEGNTTCWRRSYHGEDGQRLGRRPTYEEEYERRCVAH
mgnify:CR=1 FL=1